MPKIYVVPREGKIDKRKVDAFVLNSFADRSLVKPTMC